jgi:hypothetical protein
MPSAARVEEGASDERAKAGIERTKKMTGEMRAAARALLKKDESKRESITVVQPKKRKRKKMIPKSALASIVPLQIPAMMRAMMRCMNM